MTKTAQITELLRNRESLYRFLSRIFLLEADKELLEKIRALEFPEIEKPAELAKGYAMLKDYARSADEDSVEELAVDYARVFLAAGVAEGLAAFPYESVYTSRQRLMMQEAGGSVRAIFISKGLELDRKTFQSPEDHIGLEFEFMAILCSEGREAAESGKPAELLESIVEQRSFLEAHLLNWCGGFCKDLEKYADSGFYKAAAKITSGFMELEAELMSGGDEIWAIV